MSFTNITPFCMVPVEFIGLLSGAEIEIWLCLADWDDTGRDKELHPRIETIARRLGKARRAIENGLRSIEGKTDRLERINVSGESNIYRLNMNKRESQAPRVKREQKLTQGTQKNAQGVRNKVRTHSKVVSNNFNTNNPPTPLSGGGRDVSLETVEVHNPVTFAEWLKIYPSDRHGSQTAASRQWVKLTQLEHYDAMDGARKIAAIFEKAPTKRKRFAQSASKWLSTKAWNTSNDMLESIFEVPNFFAEKTAWDAQKKLTSELQEWEKVRWAKITTEYKKKYPQIRTVTDWDKIPDGIRMEMQIEFSDEKNRWLSAWHLRTKSAAMAELEADND